MTEGAVPDYVDPIVGWRSWYVVSDGAGRARLGSVIHRCVWPVRRELTAACLTTSGDLATAHVPPVDRCQCGIYAAARTSALANYVGRGLSPVTRLQAVGLVALWGEVVEHVQGWRASKAYPQRLWLPTCEEGGRRLRDWDELALDLAAYGVPVQPIEGGTPLEILGAVGAFEQVIVSP